MQTYAYEYCRELGRRGIETVVFTRRANASAPGEAGMTVRAQLVESCVADWKVLRTAQVDAWHVMNAAYSWLALKTSPVVVSVHGNDFLSSYLLTANPGLSTIPALWRAHRILGRLDRQIGRMFSPRLLAAGLAAATRVITNSRYTEEALLARYPRCAGRTSAAMVGVSHEYFEAPLPERRGSQAKLITVCRLSDKRKNVDVVLRALATLRDRFDFRYTVVGDGILREGLERLSRDLGIADRVQFAGFVEPARLRALLADSDLFVLVSSLNPNSHEGFGIAYLEANACGVPTLAARLAGAAEAVDEGVSGIFIDWVDEKAVAAAVARFLCGGIRFDPQACRAFARRFTWARVVDTVLPFYRGDLVTGEAGSTAMERSS
jgi:glycosyltransferase involved in cell wall biosynthesis